MTSAATKQPQTASDYRTDFLKILNNTGRRSVPDKSPQTLRLHGCMASWSWSEGEATSSPFSHCVLTKPTTNV